MIVAGLLFIPRWYFRSQCTRIAERHQHVAQAICNYRAHHGILPLELADLTPNYLSVSPDRGIVYSNGVLAIHSGLPHSYVSYAFDSEQEGWTWDGLDLPVPSVVPSVQAIEGEDRICATLAEYDRRIGTRDDSRRHRTRKISFLLSLDRNADAYLECVAASDAEPDWWRGPMGMAMLTPPGEKEKAESALKTWVDRHPAFIHYWYLAHYYRKNGRVDDALNALHQGARYPLEAVDSDEIWVPHAFAFDAASFACDHKRPELVIEITDMWSSPRGAYDYESPDLPAFRAAAFLSLGELDEAKVQAAKVTKTSQERAIWAGNLERLNAAIERNDRSFVYNPGTPYDGMFDWDMFPAPDP